MVLQELAQAAVKRQRGLLLVEAPVPWILQGLELFHLATAASWRPHSARTCRERAGDWPHSPRRQSEESLALSTCGTSSSPDKLALLSPPSSRPAAASASKRFAGSTSVQLQQVLPQGFPGQSGKPITQAVDARSNQNPASLDDRASLKVPPTPIPFT